MSFHDGTEYDFMEDSTSEFSSLPSTPGISHSDSEFGIEHQDSPVITNVNFTEILFTISIIKNLISNYIQLNEEVTYNEAIENINSIETHIMEIMNNPENRYYNSNYISAVENELSSVFNTLPEIFN